jgi:hypothetical protein
MKQTKIYLIKACRIIRNEIGYKSFSSLRLTRSQQVYKKQSDSTIEKPQWNIITDNSKSRRV